MTTSPWSRTASCPNRTRILPASAILASLLLVSPIPALATNYTDQTPCKTFLNSAVSNDKADMVRAADYIAHKFMQLDNAWIAKGNPSVMGRPSLEHWQQPILDVVGTCKAVPDTTVYVATYAVFVTAKMAGLDH